MIGRLLGRRYEILERIGGGGMSVVYRARCTILNRQVAIKVLRPQYATDEEFVRRFRREALAAASLTHPNIVSIFDVGDQGDTHYIVMEYVEGETLRDRMRRGPFRPAEAAEIAIQICDALACAHRSKVIHRDIKPLNIMITTDGRIKVADFGIAHAAAVTPITSDGTVLGSAHYLSPEQAHGAPPDSRSDIYSLGIILYEMVTGRVPFEANSPVAVAMKHITSEPVRPSRIASGVAPDMEKIILTALAKEPDRRYATAQDMKTALREFVGGAPPSYDVGPVPAEGSRNGGEDMPGGNRRRRTAVRWVIVLAVLVALGFGARLGLQQFMDWFDVPTVEVPDVVGMSEPEAVETLTGRGLSVAVSSRRYDESALDTVLGQTPKAGDMVRRGREIELTISLGPRLVEGGIPDLLRLHYREAEAKIRSLGLTVGRIAREHHASVPADYVTGQNPRPGTGVPEGTAIDLEISLGPIPVQMPDLIGQSVETARSRLIALDLEEGQITERASNEDTGTVLEQHPQPGDPVVPGTIVNLVVSSGPLIQEQRTTVWISIPESEPGLRDVVVELQDIAGRRTIYDAKHRSGDRFELAVVWKGEAAQLRVFVDRVLIAERVWP